MKQFLLIICSSLLLYSCKSIRGSGNIITEKRQAGEFKTISASGGVEVEFKMGATSSIEVEADDNIIEYIVTKIEGGVLKIHIREVSLVNGHLKVYVIAPSVNNLKSSGGADVEVKGVLTNSGKLTFNTSGGGSITADLDAPEVDADASGGGTLTLSGRTKEYSANVSGGADIKSKGLFCENTNVSASSGSSAYVHASIELTVNASSGANIHYYGTPTVKQTISSGGSVEKEE